jgi:uncharacterized protein (DUF342 family)
VRVVISRDRLEADLELDAGAKAEDLLDPVVFSLIERENLACPGDWRERVSAVLESHRADAASDRRLALARGVAPRHGSDATLELLESEGRSQGPSEGVIDHRDRRAFRAVKRGEAIARIIREVPGEDGRDVFGVTLPAREARPLELVDEPTILRGPDDMIRAAASGVVEFSGRRLRVVTRLEIERHVDFSTGHVDFPGDVTVHGGVRDRFSVAAGGELTIRDLVDHAQLRSGGDMTLERGMASPVEHGSIHAGRDLTAPLLTHVIAHVGRDAMIGKEVAGCTLFVGRELRAPSASFVRCVVHAAYGAEVGSLGSEAGVETVLFAGRVERLDDLARRVLELHAPLQSRLDAARSRLAELKRIGGKMTSAQADQLCEVELEIERDRGLLSRLSEGIRTLTQLQGRFTRVRLVVREAIHARVTLHLGRFVAEVGKTIRGPVEITTSATGEPLLHARGSGEPMPLARVAMVRRNDAVPDGGLLLKLAEGPSRAAA